MPPTDLDQQQIPYRLFRHAGRVESLEQAAAERGERPEQVVRTIVFRLGEGEFALALMAGPRQVSWPALRRTLGQRRLTMASPEEVRQATGYVPGTVSPFGLPAPLRVLVDRSVLGAGRDLARFGRARPGDRDGSSRPAARAGRDGRGGRLGRSAARLSGQARRGRFAPREGSSGGVVSLEPAASGCGRCLSGR